MSIKKTSILALSVLLSYESFAAPTVLATTPRLGASSSVASTGRGKATTSVSIGGGLNKLTSNRGQSSFTPNSAPTDKQNELIENFQKEIQNVRDAVAEELQAQNDKIRELESVIEEKDEKIAELEESIDEKIESKGFVTAESVTSEISTAKQEAVRQATNAAVKEVNSMGFAKTATVQSEISTAKNAAIAQAKTEAVAEVNGMGFAKTATVQSEISTATNAAIDAALAEVESKGFATNVSVQNLKAEITTERNEALKSYATSAQLAEDIDAAKSEITTARNTALQSYATSAQLAEDIDAAKSEITTERNTALQSYAKSADVSNAVTAAKTDAITTANNAITTAIAAESAARSAIVATLATKEELQNLEVGVDESTVAGIVDEVLDTKKVISENTPAFQDVQQQVAAMPTTYAKSSALTDLDTRVKQNTQDIAKADTAIKAEATTRTEIVATLATKKELQDLELGVDESTVAGIVDEVLGTKKVISENTPAFQDVQQQVAAMPTTYAKSSALTSLDAKVTKNTDDIAAFQAEVDNISDTIARDLLADTTFKAGVLEGLSTDLTGLPARVTALDNAVKDLGNIYATNEALNRVDGRFADYLKKNDFDSNLSSSTVLAGKFADYLKKNDFDSNLSSSTVLAGKFADYLKKNEFESNLSSSTVLAGKFADYLKKNDFDSRLSSSTALDGKFADYLKKNEFESNLSNSTALAGKFADYLKKNEFESNLSSSTVLAGKFADYLMIENFGDQLGKDYTFSKLQSNVNSLDSGFSALREVAITTENMVNKGVITTGNFADKLTANKVVTTDNLTESLEANSTFTSIQDYVDEQRTSVDDGTTPDHEMTGGPGA